MVKIPHIALKAPENIEFLSTTHKKNAACK